MIFVSLFFVEIVSEMFTEVDGGTKGRINVLKQ